MKQKNKKEDFFQRLLGTSVASKLGSALTGRGVIRAGEGIIRVDDRNFLTLFNLGGGQKVPPTSFSPVASTNVRLSPQKFLTFNFNPFATLV